MPRRHRPDLPMLSILCLPLVALAAAPAAQTPAPPPPPNVVLIYGDDVGWGDLGCYGADKIPTPNLDALAAAGLRFTDAHCTAATCSPSRFSLLTGVHGFRKNVRILPPDAPLAIPTAWLTLPRLFRDQGFDTAVVGKWHLGLGERGKRVDWNADVAPGPLELGFGYSFLLPSTNDRVPCVYLDGHRVVGLDPVDPLYVGKAPTDFRGTVFPNGKQDRAAMTYYPSSHGHNDSVIGGIGRIGRQWGGAAAVWNDETMADVFVDRAKAWLAARRDRPFFLFFSSQDIHVPRTPHPRFRGRSQLSFRGDAMVQLDWAVGQLLAAIDAAGQRDNTIVIFASDNGPVYDDGYVDGTTVRTSTAEVDRGHDGSGPFRGGKYQVYEGGTRTPLIVRWPARVRPGVSHALVSQIDFLASFATLLGAELAPEQAIDSRNHLPALLGEDPAGAPHLIEEARRLALRSGRWKYVRPQQRRRGERGKDELYDLATDPGETHDLAPERPDLTQRLRALLNELTSSPKGLRAHG
ncbi:MAG: arylsulfatase [bacterium]|nr:arylsulfatase [bacterium]